MQVGAQQVLLGFQFQSLFQPGFQQAEGPARVAAGNILKGVQLSIVAAGDGAMAAFAINRELTREDFSRRA